MSKHQVGRAVARQIRTTEHALDKTIAELGRLVSAMAEGRTEARLAAAVGQDAFVRVAAALHGIAGVRGDLVLAHGELQATAESSGIDYLLSGPGEQKPGDDRPVGTRPFLLAA